MQLSRYSDVSPTDLGDGAAEPNRDEGPELHHLEQQQPEAAPAEQEADPTQLEEHRERERRERADRGGACPGDVADSCWVL